MRSTLPRNRPADILVVDDNPTDVTLTREGFKRAQIPVNMYHVENGEDCLSFLRKEGSFAEMPTPDLVLLDLNMPIMDGREVLGRIVKDDTLNHLPIIILSTSDDERDVLTMYKMRCNAYVKKPVDFNRFEEVVHEITRHWFSVVALPKKTDTVSDS